MWGTDKNGQGYYAIHFGQVCINCTMDDTGHGQGEPCLFFWVLLAGTATAQTREPERTRTSVHSAALGGRHISEDRLCRWKWSNSGSRKWQPVSRHRKMRPRRLRDQTQTGQVRETGHFSAVTTHRATKSWCSGKLHKEFNMRLMLLWQNTKKKVFFSKKNIFTYCWWKAIGNKIDKRRHCRYRLRLSGWLGIIRFWPFWCLFFVIFVTRDRSQSCLSFWKFLY